MVTYRFCVFFAYKTKWALSIKEPDDATVKTWITHEFALDMESTDQIRVKVC